METARFTNPSQQWCTRSWDFHIVRAGVVPRDTRFHTRFVGVSCRCMEGFSLRGWDHILPGWHWLHEPQPFSNPSLGLGFPHLVGRYHPGAAVFVPGVLELTRAGRYRPGEPPFSFPVYWSCRCMEGFLIRAWDPTIFPRWHCLHEPQPISSQRVGLGFSHRAGRYRPGVPPFSSSRFVGVTDVWKDL